MQKHEIKLTRAKDKIKFLSKELSSSTTKYVLFAVVLIYLYIEISFNVALVTGRDVVDFGRYIAAFGAGLMVFRLGYTKFPPTKSFLDKNIILLLLVCLLTSIFFFKAEHYLIESLTTNSSPEKRYAAMNSLLLSKALHAGTVRPEYMAKDTLDSQEKRNIYAVLSALNTANNTDEQTYIEENRIAIVKSMVDITSEIDRLYDGLASAATSYVGLQSAIAGFATDFRGYTHRDIDNYASYLNNNNSGMAESSRRSFERFVSRASNSVFGHEVFIPIDIFMTSREGRWGDLQYTAITDVIGMRQQLESYFSDYAVNQTWSRIPEEAKQYLTFEQIEAYVTTPALRLAEFRENTRTQIENQIVAEQLAGISLPQFLTDGERKAADGRLAIQQLYVPAIAIIFSLIFSFLNGISLVWGFNKIAGAGLAASIAVLGIILKPADVEGWSGIIFGLERIILAISNIVPMLPI